LSRLRKTVSVGDKVTSGGRPFQRQLPATGNAWSSTVEHWKSLLTHQAAWYIIT